MGAHNFYLINKYIIRRSYSKTTLKKIPFQIWLKCVTLITILQKRCNISMDRHNFYLINKYIIRRSYSKNALQEKDLFKFSKCNDFYYYSSKKMYYFNGSTQLLSHQQIYNKEVILKNRPPNKRPFQIWPI